MRPDSFIPAVTVHFRKVMAYTPHDVWQTWTAADADCEYVEIYGEVAYVKTGYTASVCTVG